MTTSYMNTVSQIVQRLALDYGSAPLRFTSGDLDAANLGAFDSAHPQPVGVYLANGENVFSTMSEVAASIGAQVAMSREGLLQLHQIALPAAGTPTAIGPADMLENSLSISLRTEVVGAVVLGYCKNWTVQENLQTNIDPANAVMFATEYLTATYSDLPAMTAYRLTAKPQQQNTLLLADSDASAEAQRRCNLYCVPRTVYTFTGLPQLLMLKLGQAVTLTSYRFGLASGASGMVVSLAPDWTTRRVQVGVLV